MQLNIKGDMKAAEKALGTLKKQVPYAAWLAQKETAFKIRGVVQKHMTRVFKTTARYTLQAAIVDYQNYSDYKKDGFNRTMAVDLISQFTGRTGNRLRSRHYLWDHIHGERSSTGFEMSLRKHGILGNDEYAVKTRYAMVYAQGRKLPKGFYQSILSQLRATRNARGYDANATDSKRSKAKRLKRQFFLVRTGRLRGVWMRTRSDDGNIAVPVFIFVKHTSYKKRLRFYEVSQGAANKHWPIEFKKALRKALDTAK